MMLSKLFLSLMPCSKGLGSSAKPIPSLRVFGSEAGLGVLTRPLTLTGLPLISKCLVFLLVQVILKRITGALELMLWISSLSLGVPVFFLCVFKAVEWT